MHKPKNFYLWLVAVSLLLPLMEFVVFAVIYSSFIELAIEISACYIPISIVSGAFLLYLMMSTTNKKGKKYIFCGYVLSLVLTLITSVMLKEVSHLLVANVLGGIILLGGPFIAYMTKPRKSLFYI